MDSCRQPDAASQRCSQRRRIDRARKSHRQLRKEGPPLRRARRAGGRQRQNAAGALPAHRDLPAARTGGGVTMPITVDYYMTLNSPWTYLGSALLAEIARRHSVTVNVKPAKFAPIFEQTGGLPLPKRSPQRRAYRMMELKRWREVRAIPINLEPKHFPCDDAEAARL